ncbi:hypothetical protein [Okeania sp.]|uniref:hypothetical protein n=1 Tax=Okeania sp. TaxID=3100323 RepID=UPI002B4B43D6|nr:hypothetical protein [Okeania sp.]MEB3342183.1 hypothetical protein [Okeania sp.]
MNKNLMKSDRFLEYKTIKTIKSDRLKIIYLFYFYLFTYTKSVVNQEITLTVIGTTSSANSFAYFTVLIVL